MYRLYVDEVGTDCLTDLNKDRNRYLSLTGIAMELSHARDHLTPAIHELKASVFDHDPDAPIILHRSEILGGKGPFERIRTDSDFREKFNVKIFEIFSDISFTVITALIDKEWMLKQKHWQNTHPYHYLMEILVEKYVQFLERRNDIGDIMPESRQGKDALLQSEFERVRISGTSYVSDKRMQSSLRASKLKFRKKTDNIAGLQLCDLLAHPSHMYVRGEMGHQVNLGQFTSSVAEVLVRNKYDRSHKGMIRGYGFKHLP